MGLFSMFKKDKQEFNNQEPVKSIKIGGGGLSISQNKEWQKETFHVVTSEVLYTPVDEIFMAGHVYLGTGSDGIPIFKKLTNEQARAKAAMGKGDD